MKTLVIGASQNTERYSNKAVKLLRQHKHEVFAIGNKIGEIDDVKIFKQKIEITDLHTITLYLNPFNQKEYYNYILSLKPKRIIFNPGTENQELIELAEKQGIKTVESCTLVMLNSGMF